MVQHLKDTYTKLRTTLESIQADAQHLQADNYFVALVAWNRYWRQAVRLVQTELDKNYLYHHDIVSVEDLAIYLCHRVFRCVFSDPVYVLAGLAVACCTPGPHSPPVSNLYGVAMSELTADLLYLLKPIDEELLPPDGPTDWRIWKIFASAEIQLRQFCLVAFHATLRPVYFDLRYCPFLETLTSKFAALPAAFKEVQATLASHSEIPSKLHLRLNNFRVRLDKLCLEILKRTEPKRTEPKRTERGPGYPIHYSVPMRIKCREKWTERMSWLQSEASEIAAEVDKLHAHQALSPESSRWEMISQCPGHQVAEDWALRSVASCHSVESEMSYLSAKGGPHCFLPSYLFKQVGDEFPYESLVRAQDLVRGKKILSADGDPLEVTKVEVQSTKKLIDLEIDDAVPFTTTPQHRIMIPSKDNDATVKAMDLEVEDQEVVAITFNPDKAVACYLPPEKPLLLTKGRTPKPIHRGGMCRRGAQQEVVSMPDTAPGEYED